MNKFIATGVKCQCGTLYVYDEIPVMCECGCMSHEMLKITITYDAKICAGIRVKFDKEEVI